MTDTEKCIECGKVLKDQSHAPYCKACDTKLDRQFDEIEDNILVYKELLDSEMVILDKFEKKDIEDLFKRVYKKFEEEKKLDNQGLIILDRLKEKFKIDEEKLGLPDITEMKAAREDKLLKSNQCPECEKKIQADFNLCPYCGYKLKKDML